MSELSDHSQAGRLGIRHVAAALGCALFIAMTDAGLRSVLAPGLTLPLPMLIFAAGLWIGRWRLHALGAAKASPLPPLSAEGAPAAAQSRSLDDLSNTTPERFSDNQASSAAAGDPAADRIAADLEGYPIFTEILEGETHSLIGVTEEAAKSIFENLSQVDERFTAVVKFIQQAGSNGKITSVVTQIEEQTRDCRELLRSFVQRQQGDAKIEQSQRAKLIEDTNLVMGALEGVNGIARQTTMLSLNVSIEAARVGEAGKGFSLIAAEIRKLAKEVQELSTDVQTRVQALMHTVTVELKDRAQQRQESEQVSIQNLSETLGSLTDNLTAVVAYQRDTLQKVESESSDAVVPIMEIIGSIQFQDTVRKHVEQLQRTARLVDEHIASIAATRDGPQNEAGQISLADKLDEIQGTHETARPRSVDDAATGRRAA